MCTVVVRWAEDEPVRILALRDELSSREFDDPGEWWPEQPHVVGGRDRSAGGTWCAADPGSGVTALVLNRPEKRVADAGAPSRGVLPLLALRYGAAWTSHLDVHGMASFLLVLAAPGRLTSWIFDGTTLLEREHSPGTQMFTSGYEEDGKIARYLPMFRDSRPDDWPASLAGMTPENDPAALIVRHPLDDLGRPGDTFATVFGQLIEASPGHLEVRYSRRPHTDEPWAVLTRPA